jgi:hypothetical protein
MSKTSATLGAGVEIGYSSIPTANPIVWTKIANLIDVTLPRNERDDVEISNHDSDDLRKEYIPGWNGATDLTAQWVYNKTDAATLQGFQADGVIRHWRALLPDSASENFTGYVKSAGVMSPRTDKMTSDVTIKLDDSDLGFTVTPYS